MAGTTEMVSRNNWRLADLPTITMSSGNTSGSLANKETTMDPINHKRGLSRDCANEKDRDEFVMVNSSAYASVSKQEIRKKIIRAGHGDVIKAAIFCPQFF